MSAPDAPPQPEIPEEVKVLKTSGLLDEIKEGKELKDVSPVEGVGAAQERALYGIKKFNKNRLSHVTVDEKNFLPDAETIAQEKAALEAGETS